MGYNDRLPQTIQEALKADQLYLEYQPIIDLRTGTLVGMEGLVRSRSPDFPNAFEIIRAAVEAEFMGVLGRALRKMAVSECPNMNLFINIHPEEFKEGWLVQPIDPLFQHEELIFLEITESVPLSHYKYCNSVLREIRGKGMRLAIDDFGAGYSNVKYISDLAPEVVKLDRELIAGLTKGTRLHTLVRSIVRMCEEQNARVVAEGIETMEELRAVIDTGAHYGQGYLLARPAYPPPTVDWSVFAKELSTL